MSTITRITPEELANLPDAKNFELVDGELVEKNVSVESSLVGAEVLTLLNNEAHRTNEAYVFPNDLGYQCYLDDPDRIRKPDVSVVRSERLAAADIKRGYMRIPADLVVEVISPNDASYEVIAKIREYLAAGFPLIWVIHPNVRTVTIYTRGKASPIIKEEADEITAEPALAEFRCKVSAFFTRLDVH